ncbi:MAG: ring-hydroxylating dioxygenase, large terminal subunit [Thermoleophilia bacterium]|nr:ring-hydroxylating dioxygenase, large terminal subunit [Thermoleophilia bacterium]
MNIPTVDDGRFANPAVLLESWYVACRAKELKPGAPRSFDLAGRRLVVFRRADGSIHAMNGRCAHLGADLGQGRVTPEGELECAFHHWRFGTDGACTYAKGLDTPPGRRLTTYPAREHLGLIWVYTGPEPSFDLPVIDQRLRPLHVPSQHIDCHPHLVLGNVYDIEHFGALHGVTFSEEPTIERTSAMELRADVVGGFESRFVRTVTGSGHGGIEASFRTLGGSITWVEVRRPFPFHVVFTGRPTSSGGCDTQTVFLVPRSPVKKVRAVLLVMALLHDDSRILNRMQFTPAFTDADAGMAALAALLDEQPVAWDAPAPTPTRGT